MPQRRVRGGIRVSPLSRIMAGALDKATAHPRSEDWSLKTWIPFGQVDRERARPTAASHARAEWLSFSVTSSAVRNRLTQSQACRVRPTKAPASVRLLSFPALDPHSPAEGGVCLSPSS